MKKSAWGVLFGLVVALSSCKPMARQGGDPVSDPERAVSDNGTMLTAMAGKNRGICMVRSSLRGKEKPELLTENGAISNEQLKKALKFMSYGEQISTVLAGALIAGAAGVYVVKEVLKDTGQVKAGNIRTAAAVGIVSLVGGFWGYRIVKGNVEGEKAAPIAVHSILAGTVVGAPIVEYYTREGRLEKVLSDKEEYKFTDKRMLKLIENIRSTYPDYAGGCDHIKSQLR